MKTDTERHSSLGKKFRDPITDYEGTAIARIEYLSGCFHLELQRAGKEGKPESEWFDEERVVPVEGAEEHKDKERKRSPGTPPSGGFSHP